MAQQRLWLLDRLEGGSSRYNLVAASRIRGAVNLVALQQTLRWLVERHESARTPAIRQTQIDRLAEYLNSHPDDDAADLAWTLCEGRPSLPEAAFVVSDSSTGLAYALQTGAAEKGKRPEQAPRIAFLYPGQGSQQVGTARLLYADEPVFRAALDDCAKALLAAGLADVRDFLLASPSPELEAFVRETIHAQPVIFALSHALTALWRQRGITPSAVLGHSSGEYAAAVAAGVFSLEEAARALAARARLMAGMPAGGMTAVGLAEGELIPLLPAGLAIAAISGPALCTVAGDLEILARFERALAPRGIFLRRLQTAHAFHTSAVDGVLSRFRADLVSVNFQAPRLPFYSSVLGRQATDEEITDRQLWENQIRLPVRFAPALEALLADGYTAFVEVGPGSTLATLAHLSPRAENVLLVPGLSRVDDPCHDLLTGLGQLWLAGAKIPWSNLFANDHPRRLSLPTYPFSTTRHWIETAPARHPAKFDTSNPIRLLVPGWQRVTPLSSAMDVALAARWLVFADAGDVLSESLIARLRRAGGSVAVVRPGDDFSQQNDEWSIATRCDADYLALLSSVRPQRVLHAWHFSAEPDNLPCPSCLDSLIRLLRAIAAGGNDLNEIAVLSCVALDVTGSETLNPAQATLLGPVRGVPLEFPDIRCRLLDVDSDGDTARLTAAIAAELAGTVPEPVTALRGGHRWLPNMMPVQPMIDIVSPVRADGVYLITGGLGGLGLAVAEQLAKQTRVRLALIGRTPLLPESEWKTWLDSQPKDDPTRQIIAKLMSVRALGSQVLVLTADIADPEQTAKAMGELRQRWGEPDGVIHAAGTPGGGAIARRNDDDLAAVLRPKIVGTEVLLAAMGNVRPDFVLFFSTINTLWPVPGQTDYAAANAYLEGKAAQLRRQGIRATAINWDAWRSVGMAAHFRLPAALQNDRLLELERYGLGTDDACRALIDILAADYTQVIVTTTNRMNNLAEQRIAAKEPETWLENQEDTIIDGLAEIWKSLLGISELAPEDNFFQRGGHSLLATRVGFRVRQRWGSPLSLNDIFAHPTLIAMADLIESRTQAETERESFLF